MLQKIAVVTGANAGLGYQISLALARKGMRVVMACRNQEKAEVARQGILAEFSSAELVVVPLDVSEPDSIRLFTEQFSREFGVLDLLVNNAGIVGMPLQRNSCGQEMHLATNYLGAFALTGRLMPFFRDEAPSRIVNVGSLAHLFGKLNLEDFNWDAQPYNQWRAYARSKLALLTFTVQLGQRLSAIKSPIIALAAHPGFAATEILGDRASSRTNPLANWYTQKMTKLVPEAKDAAQSILYAACSDDVGSGEYYGPGGFLGIAGEPSRARVAKSAFDMAAGERLWTASEAISGVSFLSDSKP